MSEPVKPIVYYLDRTIPEKFKPWVKRRREVAEGVRPPASATRSSRWTARRKARASIRGRATARSAGSRRTSRRSAPSDRRVDPRTGEIFDADILFEASMFQNYSNAYRRYWPAPSSSRSRSAAAVRVRAAADERDARDALHGRQRARRRRRAAAPRPCSWTGAAARRAGARQLPAARGDLGGHARVGRARSACVTTSARARPRPWAPARGVDRRERSLFVGHGVPDAERRVHAPAPG